MQNIQDYVIEEEIGHGSFATVYKGYHKETRQNVAIKVVHKSKLNKKLAENLETEISILKGISHPNIVNLYDIQKTEGKIYLVMEYCGGGDLSSFLKKKKILKEATVKHFIKQLASALECLRGHNLIHRDLKPQNLLLTSSEESAILKIADFGFARHIDPSDMAETLCGSPLYMAPEILRYEKYDAKADLWSVGAIMYEMIYGRPPFRAQNHIQLLKKIEATAEIPFPSSIPIIKTDPNDPSAEPKQSLLPIVISDSYKDIVKNLLKRNPIERICFEEFFLHSFLNAQDTKLIPLDRKAMSSQSLPKFQLTSQRRPSLPVPKPMEPSNLKIEKPKTMMTGLSSSPRTIRSKSFGNGPSVSGSIPKSIGSGSRLFEISSFGSKDPTILLSAQKSLTISYKNAEKDEIPVLQELEFLLKFAGALIEVFHQRNETSESSRLSSSLLKFQHENLILLLKAISLFEESVNIGKSFWEQQNHLISGQMTYVIQYATEEFRNTFDKADKLKNKIFSLDQNLVPETNREITTVEDLLYSHAMKLSRNAAVDELLGYFHSSEKQYQKSLFILGALVAPFSSKIDTRKIPEEDLIVLKKCICNLIEIDMNSIEARLNSVRQKKEQKN